MVKEYEIEDLMININWNCLSYHEFVPSKSWIVWSLAFDRTIKTPALWSEILFPNPGDRTYLQHFMLEMEFTDLLFKWKQQNSL